MKLPQSDFSCNQTNQTATQLPKLEIAAEFHVNQYRFLIVSGYGSSDVPAKSALELNKIDKEQIVGQFQFEGKTYTIVKGKDYDTTEKLDLAEVLTARELQIAALVAQGKSNKQIAKRLQISKWTVSTHLRRIFMKLQVDNRAAMVYSCFGVLKNLSFIE